MRSDQQIADLPSWPPIGGDFGLDWSELGAEKTRSSLFAAGRDALAAIVRQQPATRGRFFVGECGHAGIVGAEPFSRDPKGIASREVIATRSPSGRG